jgi:hypothetical protein
VGRKPVTGTAKARARFLLSRLSLSRLTSKRKARAGIPGRAFSSGSLKFTCDKRYQNESSSGTNGNASGYESVSSRRSAHVRLDGLGSPPALGPFFESIAQICRHAGSKAMVATSSGRQLPLHMTSVLRRIRPTHSAEQSFVRHRNPSKRRSRGAGSPGAAFNLSHLEIGQTPRMTGAAGGYLVNWR